jgi:hypothetical protein
MDIYTIMISYDELTIVIGTSFSWPEVVTFIKHIRPYDTVTEISITLTG